MSKRWSFAEDIYFVRWFKYVDYSDIARDLNRPEGGARLRHKKLKETGAWDALEEIIRQEDRYREVLGLKAPWESADAA